MKTINLFLCLFLILVFNSCYKKIVVDADYNIVPLPQKIMMADGDGFELKSSTKIVYPKGDTTQQKNAIFLAEYISLGTGLKLTVTDNESDENDIFVKADYQSDNKEAYNIIISDKSIVINGSDAAGTFHGIQTLRKSIPGDANNNNTIIFPAAEITDYPRFAYRGMMLDVSRHFFSVEDVKNYIDILAMHNLNRFHWHLTDDQGWRIEIKKYPELTKIGSERAQTVIGRNSGKFDGKPYGGFYTQEQIKDVVAYAQERYITIIPEIDLPGHMLAALATFPNLGCTGGPYKVCEEWGIFEDVLCAGNEEVYTFLENVFAEIIALFPSEYIHVGGDECPKTKWKTCPKCQAKAKELGLKSDKEHSKEDKLQSYVISRIEKFINSKGRQIIGWDEILEGGPAPNATIMSWRGIEGGIAAAKMGHNVIMTPSTNLYFDYYQTGDIDSEPFAIGGYLPVNKVYSFDPLPKELTAEQQKHIIGVQANLWTEYILDLEQVQYMLLPRLGALSEIQWCMPENMNYEAFLPRLANMIKLYKRYGYNYATHIFDIIPKTESNKTVRGIIVTLSTFDNAPIYYTLDGSEPTEASTKYEQPLTIKADTQLKAIAIRETENSRIYTKSFYVNKATFNDVTLVNPPTEKYTYGGAATLVDGLKGGEVYSNGEWLGFLDKDFVAIVDLNIETEVSEVSIGSFLSVNDWIFGATRLSVLVSSDNKNFKQVFDQQYPVLKADQKREVRDITATFSPEKCRYVKIVAKPLNSLPDWSQGKGAKGFLFIDEISIK